MRTLLVYPVFVAALLVGHALFGDPLSAVDLRLMASATAPRMQQQCASAAALWRRAVLDPHRQRSDAPAALQTPEFHAVLATACDAIADYRATAPSSASFASAAAFAKTRDVVALFADFALHVRHADKAQPIRTKALLAAFEADERAQGRTRFPLPRLAALSELLGSLARSRDPADQANALASSATLAAVYAATLRSGIARDHYGALCDSVIELDFNDPRIGTVILAELDALQGALDVPAPLLDACRAKLHITQAWAYRGGGYANAVTPEGWAGFQRHLAKADALVESAWRAEPLFFRLAGIGLTLAGASQATTDADTWMLRGLTACADDTDVFSSRLYYLVPRWGGSYAEMLALASDILTACEAEPSLDQYWLLKPIAAITHRIVFDQRPMSAEAKAALSQRDFHDRLAVLGKRISSAHPDVAAQVDFLRAALLWHGGYTAEAETIFRALPEPAKIAELAERSWEIKIKGLGKGAKKPPKSATAAPGTATIPAPASTSGAGF